MKVRDLIKVLERDGWQQVRMKGSHRQFRHPLKHGTLTVAGKVNVDIPTGTLASILKHAGLKDKKLEEYMKYMVVIEKGETSFGAHVPDLPGCIAVGKSREEVLRLIKEAIELHIEALRESGERVPSPSSVSEYIEIRAA